MKQVAYWAVDFVPDRFGPGRLTRLYDSLDAWVCRHADARFEVSDTALNGRAARHRLGPDAAPAHVAPMGAWLDRVPRTQPDGAGRRCVVWIGHMVERQGVGRLIEALALLAARDVPSGAARRTRAARSRRCAARSRTPASAIACGSSGTSPITAVWRRCSRALSVAVAPYDTDACVLHPVRRSGQAQGVPRGRLPIVTTDVPPNAHEVARARRGRGRRVRRRGARRRDPAGAGRRRGMARPARGGAHPRRRLRLGPDRRTGARNAGLDVKGRRR